MPWLKGNKHAVGGQMAKRAAKSRNRGYVLVKTRLRRFVYR